MKKIEKDKPDYDLLISAERIRYQSDFSSSHWMCQLICEYLALKAGKLRDEYEKILRIAIKAGVKKAREYADTLPRFLGIPKFLDLSEDEEQWKETKKNALKNFSIIETQYRYLKEGD